MQYYLEVLETLYYFLIRYEECLIQVRGKLLKFFHNFIQ